MNNMAGFQIVTHKGKNISLIDLSNTKTAQSTAILKEAQTKITKMPPKSALLLTDETNAEVTKEAVYAIMEFAKNNTPFVKASAVVGAEKLKHVMLLNVSTTVGRDIQNFENRAKAMDWLINQP
jgi:hypothetical protein